MKGSDAVAYLVRAAETRIAQEVNALREKLSPNLVVTSVWVDEQDTQVMGERPKWKARITLETEGSEE